MATAAQSGPEAVERLREVGNQHVAKRKYKEATSAYAAALEACPLAATSLRSRLLSNIALCHLKCGSPSEVFKAASEAWVLDRDNTKAAYRRALAELELCEPEAAARTLEVCAELYPQEAWVSELREPLEGAFGRYDWKRLFFGSLPNEGLGPGEFIHPGIAVTQIGGEKGRGLTNASAETIPAGTLLLVEQAVMTERYANLASKVSERARDAGFAASRLRSLCRRTENLCEPVPLARWGADVDDSEEFRKVDYAHVVDSNAMATITFSLKPSGLVAPEGLGFSSDDAALYSAGSLMNHSCLPNVHRLPLGRYLVVRAAKDIPAGEELTTNYTEVRCPLRTRQAEIRQKWGFSCTCGRCLAEARLTQTQRNEVERCYAAFEAMQASRSGDEDEMRRVLLDAMAVAKLAADRCRSEWILVACWLRLAWEFAHGLTSLNRHREATEAWTGVERCVRAVLPMSAVHVTCSQELAVAHRSAGRRRDSERCCRESRVVTARAYGEGVWEHLMGSHSSDWPAWPSTDASQSSSVLSPDEPWVVGQALAMPRGGVAKNATERLESSRNEEDEFCDLRIWVRGAGRVEADVADGFLRLRACAAESATTATYDVPLSASVTVLDDTPARWHRPREELRIRCCCYSPSAAAKTFAAEAARVVE
eukprot:TRINITY_DN30271_c0_g1_i1.p1 TRINITY_DN30271_c0_g1~~TRINITY_DN30271_c0_g1_i1.p1  ORF type:complete len:669 (-),score=78.38 TRINITY_DN30271_c0_g1_i1:87-2045(-)